jgi:hypothetical protein
VFGDVMLGGLFGVVFSMHVMTVRQVSVVTGSFVIARLVMLGGGQMELGRLLMMFGCLTMMFRALFRHGFSRFRSEMQNSSSVSSLSLARLGYKKIAVTLQMGLRPKRCPDQ